MHRTHDELRELIAPYSLGAVSPEEEAEVRTHLRYCSACRSESESFASVASSLSLVAAPSDVPAGFLERTVDKVSTPGAARSVDLRRRPLGWVLAGAAVTAVVALLAASLTARSDLAEVREIKAAMLDEDAIRLEGEAGVAHLVEVDDETRLVAEAMAPPPEGRVYQLWKMSAGCAPGGAGTCAIESAGVVEIADDDVNAPVDVPLEEFEEAAMTIEEREVDQPTAEPVMTSFGA